jgi:uncharacterized protein
MEKQKITKSKYCYVLRSYPEYYDHDSWTEEASEIVGRHFNYLKDLTEKQIVIMAGRTLNEPMTQEDFGIVILETNSIDLARNIMDNDPSIKGNVMYGTLYDFSLALLRK